MLGDSRGAQRIVAALDAAGDAAAPCDRADALLLAAWIEASTGRLDQARDHIAAATEVAETIHDVDLQARCCYYLAYVVSHDGEFRRALELTDRSDRLCTPSWTGRGIRPPTGCSPPALRSRPTTKRAAWKLSITSSVGYGSSMIHGCAFVADAVLGELARIQRRFDDAVIHLSRAAEASQRLGFRQTEAYQLSSLGRAQCQAGDYESGVDSFELAIVKAEATGDVRLAALAASISGASYVR